MTDRVWFLATTQPSRERWAAENIQRQGWEFYLPMISRDILVGSRDRRRKVLTRSPLFPRYLFVCTDGTWRFLTGTWGVTGVVMRGDAPEIVRPKIISQIKDRESDGVVELPQAPRPRFEPGQQVRVLSGPFKDWIGVYEGMQDKERVRVLLQLFGRDNPISIKPKDLEPK